MVESGTDVKMFLFVFEKVSNIKCRKMMQENAVFAQKPTNGRTIKEAAASFLKDTTTTKSI